MRSKCGSSFDAITLSAGLPLTWNDFLKVMQQGTYYIYTGIFRFVLQSVGRTTDHD